MSDITSTIPTAFPLFQDLKLTIEAGVAVLTMNRPPHNFFDEALIRGLVDALNYLDGVDDCRAVVLASEGKSFCAGADFSIEAMSAPGTGKRLYARALSLFRTRKPIIAAVQGAAVGGGLGLALAADFRIVAASSRMSANFCRLGIHPGFGLSVTLPRLVGGQRAAMMLYTGNRVEGVEAVSIGLADVIADEGQVLSKAIALAAEIAASAPLALLSTRATLRGSLASDVVVAMEREAAEQDTHWRTLDFKEGVAAMAARRRPVFVGR